MIYIFTALFVLGVVHSHEFIRSHRITNWGAWGELQKCPPDHFVNSIAIKYETWFGAAVDDTALNGIALHCTPLRHGSKDVELTYPSKEWKREDANIVTSDVGPYGKWLAWNNCPNGGIAVAFQLKSEPSQGDGDDTTANDVSLICLDREGKGHVTDTNGGKYGEWGGGEQMCPTGTAICGLRSQIEHNQGKEDDTALNNVDMLCCDLPTNVGRKCKVSEKYHKLWSKTVPSSGESARVSVPFKIGLNRGRFQANKDQDAVLEALAFNRHFGDRRVLVRDLKNNFDSLKKTRGRTGYDWNGSENKGFLNEDEMEYSLNMRPGCTYTLNQLVGYCGTFMARTDEIKNVKVCN